MPHDHLRGPEIASGGSLEQADLQGFTPTYLVSLNRKYSLAVWASGDLCIYRTFEQTGFQTRRWSSLKAHGSDYAKQWVDAGASFSLQMGWDGDVAIFAHLPSAAPVRVWGFATAGGANAGAHLLLHDDGALCLIGVDHSFRVLAQSN